MKKSILLTLLAAILCTGCDVVKVKQAEQPRIQRMEPFNLGFEEGDPGAQMPGWWYGPEMIDTHQIEVVDEVKRSGAKSAFIKFRRGEQPWGSFNQDYVGKVFAGRTVRVKAWIKVEDTEVCDVCNKPNLDEATLPEDPRKGAQLRVLGYAPSGGVTETLVRPLVMGTKNWTRFEAVTTMPADLRSAIVSPILWGKGKAWFDDIEVLVE